MSKKDESSDRLERLAGVPADKSGKSKKSRKPEPKEEPRQDPTSRKQCKTPQVMKLVEVTRSDKVMQAGKSKVPDKLRGKESLTKVMRKGLGEEFYDLDDSVVVNVTELALLYEAPVILDRFNACSCDRCVEVFTKIIAERVPMRFARVSRSAGRAGTRELNARVAPMRKVVLKEMIKELVASKKRCFHDDEDDDTDDETEESSE